MQMFSARFVCESGIRFGINPEIMLGRTLTKKLLNIKRLRAERKRIGTIDKTQQHATCTIGNTILAGS